MFLWIIIFFFIILLTLHFISNITTFREGMDDGSGGSDGSYTTYDTNDPNNAMILAQQNAGNISFLKTRVDDLAGIDDKVTSLQSQVDQMSSQIDDLVQQQADYAQDLAGDTPPDVTGTDTEDPADEEDTTT